MAYGSSFIIRCTAILSTEPIEVVVQVIWTDQHLQVINMTTGNLSVGSGLDTSMFMNITTYSLDLNLNNLHVSQVGKYVCRSTFTEQDSESFILQKQFIVSVQG